MAQQYWSLPILSNILHKIPDYLLCWQKVFIFSSDLSCIWQRTVSVSEKKTMDHYCGPVGRTCEFHNVLHRLFPQPKYNGLPANSETLSKAGYSKQVITVLTGAYIGLFQYNISTVHVLNSTVYYKPRYLWDCKTSNSVCNVM